MSRGIGAVQRQILDALAHRGGNDSYPIPSEIRWLVDPGVTAARARWRWYTIDLLELATIDSPRSRRVSLHRAIHGLHDRGELDISLELPHDLGDHIDDFGDYVHGVDLSELSDLDPRWPRHPGALWFRQKPSDLDLVQPPPDDQIWILTRIQVDDDFVDFAATRDRRQAWSTETGRFIRWLLCG